MTTRLQINVNANGLLDRNFQQQLANRLAYQTRLDAEKAAALGESERRQDRIAQGRDPATGRPLPSAGSTSRLTRIDQEPAAFRLTKDNTSITTSWQFGTKDLPAFSTTGLSADTFGRINIFSVLYSFRENLLHGSGDGTAWADINIGLQPSEYPPPLPLGTLDDVGPWVDGVPTRVIKTTGNMPIVQRGHSFFALPIGGNGYILTVISAAAWNSYTITGYVERISSELPDYIVRSAGAEYFVDFSESHLGRRRVDCYLVKNNSIKTINTPTKFENIIENLGPLLGKREVNYPAWKRDTTVYVSRTVYEDYLVDAPSQALLDGTYGYLTADNTDIYTYSPDVYAALHTISPYASKIIEGPIKYNKFITDNRSGIYKTKLDTEQSWIDIYSTTSVDSLFYGRWPIKDEEPDLSLWADPDWPRRRLSSFNNTATISDSSNKSPFGYDFSDRDTFPDYNSLLVLATDWDRAAYCRARALELGFTEEDLAQA